MCAYRRYRYNVFGCLLPSASNYNATANRDDGSCILASPPSPSHPPEAPSPPAPGAIPVITFVIQVRGATLTLTIRPLAQRAPF